MSNDLLILINECLENLTDIKLLSLKEKLNFCLKKFCNYTQSKYGFISELNNVNNINYYNYRALYGFEDSSYFKPYYKYGYIQFNNEDIPYHNINDNYVYYDNTVDFDNLTKLYHYPLNNFYIFPLMHKNNVSGYLGFYKNESCNYDDKQLTLVVSFINNIILNIKNNDELETKKMSFISNMSHEVRTPLNAIITMIDLLHTTELSQIQNDYVNSIKNSGCQLMDIVNDVLDYSKIMNNGIKLKLQPMSIIKCVESVYSILEHKAFEKKIKFTYEINTSVPDMIICDVIRLKQILINLLSNSIKFTKKGHIHLFIDIIEKKDDVYNISFKVEDTGIGIKKENMEKIFDAYRQINNDYLNDSCGVGLGLAITKHIITLFNGDINISSVENEGTIVNVSLPLHIFNEVIDEDTLTKFFSNKNVLIFDTILNERLFLFKSLLKYKINSILTSSVEEIITYLSHNTFSFEFLLINLNDLNNSDILKIQQIKNHYIKIIILDINSSINNYITYDYKIFRPIDDVKIKYILNLIYTSAQYQSKTIHNEIIINETHHKISNINTSLTEMRITTPKNKSDFKILIAEDNKENQLILKELLKIYGYENIVIVSDGKETYDEIIENSYDLIFLDLKMPIMSGIQVIQKYRETQVDMYKNNNIIAITAGLSDKIKQQCFNIGMKGYIAKPIDKKDLEKVLYIFNS
jgi:CheY-like chemotaxis protein